VAYAEFVRVAEIFDATREALRAARRELTAAKARDVSAIVEATKDGGEIADPQEHEHAAIAEVDRVQALLGGFSKALDEAGNTLAQAIESHADAWASTLSDVETDAADRYARALAEAKSALSALTPARAGANWLTNFDAARAQTGQYTEFSGGRVRVGGRRAGVPEIREIDPSKLLNVAALVVAPDPSHRKELTSV
jgi:hypothetical protein